MQFLLLHVRCYLTEYRSVCEEHSATTTSELSDEDEDVGRRKVKKKTFEDYIAGKK